VVDFLASNGSYPNGRGPESTLIRDAAGNLYGTTYYGGGHASGALFKVDSAGNQTVLYKFCSVTDSTTGYCTDGLYPLAGVIQDSQGNLYGTTTKGGKYNAGTIFEWQKSTGAEIVLYSFGSFVGDGANPYASLIQDAATGNLYGTTYNGGAKNAGTIFEFKANSTGPDIVLYSFCSASLCSDGLNPYAGVIRDAAGNLYGTTLYGGQWGDGTVFQLNSNGSEKVLYSFCSVANFPGGPLCFDGKYPYGNLVQDASGNLYGTTYFGGDAATAYNVGGTVFKLDSNNTETVLHSFCSVLNAASVCTDGALPVAGLVQDSTGNLYGTTSFGGGNNEGTVFKWDKSTGEEAVLYNFCSDLSGEICTDGKNPLGGLVNGTSGNVYGTTYAGGTYDAGTVFVIEDATAMPPAFQFIPITPCRIADTRNSNGPFGGPELASKETRNFDIPQSACGIPANAAAYSFNITVVPNGGLGYLSIWPTGETQPLVSTLNSDGRVKANAAIVPAGTNGGVSVYVTDPTQVILDIDGYFVPAGSNASALAFYPLTPCRVADTRYSNGALGSPFIAGKSSRNFPVQSSHCGIPSTAKAYSFNVTAVPHKTLGYLTVWPTGAAQPLVSTLNSYNGQVVANAAFVPAGTSGGVSVYVTDDTDVLLDINGYFAPPGDGGLSLYTLTPCRVVDTRSGTTPFPGTLVVNVEGSSCAPPSTADAYVLNATVVPSAGFPYLTLWPDGQPQPLVSTLNAYDGAITSNMAIVPINNGDVDAYSAGKGNLILDISSYFAP